MILSHSAVSKFSLSVANGLPNKAEVADTIVLATNSVGGREYKAVGNDSVEYVDGDTFTDYAVFGVSCLKSAKWTSATSGASLEVDLLNGMGFFKATYTPGKHQSLYADWIFDTLRESLDYLFLAFFRKDFTFITEDERYSFIKKLEPMYVALIRFEAKLRQWEFEREEIECKASFMGFNEGRTFVNDWLEKHPPPDTEKFLSSSDWGLSLLEEFVELEVGRAFDDAYSDV